MSDINPTQISGFIEATRLLVAASIGALVVAVQRWTRRGRPLTRSMEQAHVLLCLAGALMMLIVGDSVARAFGIAGAAAIIRFRTPIEDPRDITVRSRSTSPARVWRHSPRPKTLLLPEHPAA